MMGVWFVLATLCVGPELNPIEGTTIVGEDRELFPSGRDVSSVADIWLVQVVNQQVGAGGINRFDPVRLAFHGNSWTQTRFLLNGLEMTDPGKSGAPLVEIPFGAWDALEFRYQTQAKPGFNFIFDPAREQPTLSGEMRVGRPIGGGTWVPQGLMDREPATYHGATAERRALKGATEFELQHQYRGEGWGARVGAEYFAHSHQYPGFRDDNGVSIGDSAGRLAVVGGTVLKVATVPVKLVVAVQQQRRSHEGSEFRFPLEYTNHVLNQALVVQGTARVGDFDLKLGGGWARDAEQRNIDGPLVKDLEEEWMWLERPKLPQSLNRWRWDGDLRWIPKIKPLGLEKLELGLRAGVVGLEVVPNWGTELVATTYRRAPTPDGQSVSITRYNTDLVHDVGWGDLRPEILVGGSSGLIQWTGDLGWNVSGLSHSEGELFSRSALSVGVTVRRKLRTMEFFAAMRREPEEMTSEVAGFIDSGTPEGTHYQWDDEDRDEIPQLEEMGEVLGRTGGAFHDVDPNLVTPTRNFLTVGFKTPRFGPFVFLLMTHYRWLLDRYTVRYSPEGEPEFTPREVRDPGGDREVFTLYDRTQGMEGKERFWLTNATRSDFYFGTELQLKTEATKGWFLNLSASGYLSQGSGAFGTFPDRNDSGILNEVSADPNSRVNQRSRYDHDRAFGVNLLVGWDILEQVRWTLSGRYRDGEPMTRYFVATMDQGPTPVMANERGAPIPRHTFHMTLDTRFAFQFQLLSRDGVLAVDCFNLLGSGTELLEDTRTGETWRQSLEMVPGRAVLVSVAFKS